MEANFSVVRLITSAVTREKRDPIMVLHASLLLPRL